MPNIITVALAITLACVAAGCSSEVPRSWVVGQSRELSQSDTQDLASGTKVARRYIEAWGKADYDTMWDLCCKRCVKNRDTFVKLASIWRTEGVEHTFSSITPADIKRIVASLVPLRHLSDKQAQILLSLAVVEETAYEKLKKKTWPERVMIMKLSIKNQTSLFLLVRENECWSVVNDPGTMDVKHLVLGKE